MRALIGAALIALPALLAAPAASACTGLGCSCTVSAANVAFAPYDPFAAADNDTGVGALGVTCSGLAAVSFSYTLDLSAGSGGAYANRAMHAGASALGYQLYTDASRTSIWGDGAGGTAHVSQSFGMVSLPFSGTDNYSVYGRIPAHQNVGAGGYTDQITVTITF